MNVLDSLLQLDQICAVWSGCLWLCSCCCESMIFVMVFWPIRMKHNSTQKLIRKRAHWLYAPDRNICWATSRSFRLLMLSQPGRKTRIAPSCRTNTRPKNEKGQKKQGKTASWKKWQLVRESQLQLSQESRVHMPSKEPTQGRWRQLAPSFQTPL